MKKTKRKLRFSDLSNPWQRFRSQTGLTQAQLAQLLDMKQTAISMYECGDRLPAPAYARRFLKLAKRRKIRMSMDEIYARQKG